MIINLLKYKLKLEFQNQSNINYKILLSEQILILIFDYYNNN